MRRPLRYQLLLPFAVVLLVAIAAVSGLSMYLASQRAQRQIESQLQGIAETLAESNFPLTDVVLRQMHGLSGADFVFTGDDGTVLAANRTLELPPVEDAAIARDWQQLRLGPPASIDGQKFFHMVLAMPSRGLQPAGRLHLLFPEQAWRDLRSAATLPLLLVAGIALAATALLAFLLAGRLTRPIAELQSQVSRIGTGDFTGMPLPTRNDELRDLAASVNQLATQLADMDRAIRRGERMALLGQLAGGLAHHLRNNVTGARMAVQLHARGCQHDAESLDVALRQLTLTESNLKQFLAAPHGTVENADPAFREVCELESIVAEVARLLAPSLQHKRIEFAIEHATDGETNIHADADGLRQALVNLVLNAADAAGPGGGVRIEIDRDNNEKTPRAVVRIIDTGPGPPPQLAARLFEPFVTGKSEGVGLGLSVAKQIATAHGGDLTFSRRDEETVFTMWLPRIGQTEVEGAREIREVIVGLGAAAKRG